jgi:hypothetical protein
VQKPRPLVAFRLLPCELFLIGLTLVGCEKAEQIDHYDVPKHDSLQSAAFLAESERRHPRPERMIGIIFPLKDAQWFLKLQGNVEAVTARENDVREFLKSLRFPPGEPIQWTLPTGWQQLKGTQMRYATLVLDGPAALEMTVTTLPTRDDVLAAEQVVMNINRWRGQLSLPPIESSDLAQQTEKLTLGDVEAYWVSIIGRPQPKPAAMMPPQRPAVTPEEKPVRKAEGVAPMFEKPADWSEAPPAMFAAVTLQARDGDETAKITVTPAKGNRLDNVNRWRGQAGLGEFSKEELNSAARKVPVGKLSGDLYEISGAKRAIFGVIVEEGEQMWFVKLDGPPALAARERSHFEEFLKSLQLN